MKRIGKCKSRRGFTLVELMTAIAIITIVSVIFVELIYAVKDSFYRSYNSNDSEDYAALYAQALENYILHDIESTSVPAGTYHYYIDNNNHAYFMHRGTALQLDQMTNGDGRDKWRVYMSGSYNSSTGMVSYTLYFVDNYYDPDSPLVYTYDGAFWVPCHTQDKTPHGAVNITFQNYDTGSWQGMSSFSNQEIIVTKT